MKTNNLPDRIGKFTKYTKTPNAIKFGALYTLTANVDVPFEQKRTLRVYLPEDYNEEERYPVLYMCDAQNIVDRYTSAYGEWDIDEHMHALIKEGKKSFIVAGLDCPKVPIHRMREYVLSESPFFWKKAPKAYGRQYSEYIVNVIKPLIDKTFNTLPDRENTGFGGSSMGGLCAFDMVTLYPEVFSFALSFSPAFFTLKGREYFNEVKNRTLYPNETKFYLFTGGADLDAKILPGTVKMYKEMKKCGFDDNHVALLVDSEVGHCEASWSKYVKNAIRFWQK